METSKDHFHWGETLTACFDDVREAFAVRSPPIVDVEVIPHFDGRPDDMFIWFICRRAAEVSSAAAQEGELHDAIRARMAVRGFPQGAMDSLDALSDAEIAQTLAELGPGHAIEILEKFPAERRGRIAAATKSGEGEQWLKDCHYPEGSVGRLMETTPAVLVAITTYVALSLIVSDDSVSVALVAPPKATPFFCH